MKTTTKSTDWLIAGLSNEELSAKKTLAVIAAEIQLKRIELGLDQKQFAKMLGVTQGMVSRWESGTYNFTITTLVNICEKLGLSFEPQITSKEVESVAIQKSTFTMFNFENCYNEQFSAWVPNFKFFQNNDRTEAVA